MMKNYIGIVIILISISCSIESKDRKVLDATEILNSSIAFHDSNNKWAQSALSMRIQEPRLQNPSRYSIVRFDNKDQSFELIRNREEHLSKHVVSKEGALKVYLDDNEEFADSLIEKYRLQPERNKVYSNFYKMMYGLPMTLNSNWVKQTGKVEQAMYNNRMCYMIPIELKEEMFSKNWNIFIAENTYEFKGMEIVFPDEETKGEKLYFDGLINIEGILIPRIRHWHELSNDNYLGSDIIVNRLD